MVRTSTRKEDKIKTKKFKKGDIIRAVKDMYYITDKKAVCEVKGYGGYDTDKLVVELISHSDPTFATFIGSKFIVQQDYFELLMSEPICEYCKGDKNEYIDEQHRVWISNFEPHSLAIALGTNGITFVNIKFCPMCGKNLEEVSE